MFIEKFTLKNNNAQYQYICAAVFFGEKPSNYMQFIAKNLHNYTYKSVVIIHARARARMYVHLLRRK